MNIFKYYIICTLLSSKISRDCIHVKNEPYLEKTQKDFYECVRNQAPGIFSFCMLNPFTFMIFMGKLWFCQCHLVILIIFFREERKQNCSSVFFLLLVRLNVFVLEKKMKEESGREKEKL